MLTSNSAYKYETPYKGPFFISQFWINGTVTLQCGTINIGRDICCINPYTSDTNVEDANIEKYVWRYSTYDNQLYNMYYIKA